MAQWTVYSRADCSLCEQLLQDLAEVLPSEEASQVHVVDIATDSALERKYALRIPVLTADGEFVCAYRLDRERVATILALQTR